VTRPKLNADEIRKIVEDLRLGLSLPEIVEKYAEPDLSAGLLNGLRDAAAPREPVSSLLERSRIIPAIRGPEFIQSALASPSIIVWLLYGTPLTLPDIVRQVRAAGKLPVANLDLLTGFAQDADGIEFLAAEGVAGVVSTRQSVLRAARAQGMIAVQRTFIVDSIAVGNILRALQHFSPDAVELLPAAAAPLCVATLRGAQPQLPVIATGLVTSMRQVDDLIRGGVSSVATSDVSLWVL
jgi:glycerol uptake operon antiterminator